MPTATVRAGARLHLGFTNLSLAHDRLYGGVGLALAAPHVTVEATPASTVAVTVDDDTATDGPTGPRNAIDPIQTAADRACDLLGVAGARVRVRATLPRHVGLGSGTQHALATLAAVAHAHGRPPRVRERAPALGRGGRSGVGVAAFEAGGLIVDGGHPTERFTLARPDRGSWTVPPVIARLSVPDRWRVVVAVPEATRGRAGDREDRSMRQVIEQADPGPGDELAGLVVRQLLPAAAEDRLGAFGRAAATFGRRNGEWYTDEQGGVYRPPAGAIVDRLGESPAIDGAGQSSWGPTVWALTDADRAETARHAAREALAAVDATGVVHVVRPAATGATVNVGANERSEDTDEGKRATGDAGVGANTDGDDRGTDPTGDRS